MNQLSPPENAATQSKSDDKFLYIVGALLVLILALLAGLWLSTRARAARAEAETFRLQRQEESGRLLFSQLLKERPLQIGVDRASLAERPAVLDGRKVAVLLLPAGVGRALNFEPGDVIVVENEPAATAPATGPKP